MNDIRKYFWVHLLRSTSFLAPVLTLFYLSRGLDFSEIFSLLVIIVATMLIAEVPTGVVSDLCGRKASFACGQLSFLLSTVLLILAHDYFVFALAAAVMGVGFTFFSGSDESFIHDTLAEAGSTDTMKKTMGRIWSATYIPIIISAPIGSYIAQDLTQTQFLYLLIANAAIQLFGLVIILFLNEPARKTPVAHNPFAHFMDAFTELKQKRGLLRLFINKTLVLIVGAHLWSQAWQPYFQQSDVPVVLFGWVVAIGAVLAYLSHRHLEAIESVLSDKALLRLTALLPLAAFILAATTTHPMLAVVVYLVLKTIVDMRNPFFSHHLNSHIDSHNRATMLSTLSVVDSAFDVVILLSAGFIADIGLTWAFWFAAGVIALAMLAFPVTRKQLAPTG